MNLKHQKYVYAKQYFNLQSSILLLHVTAHLLEYNVRCITCKIWCDNLARRTVSIFKEDSEEYDESLKDKNGIVLIVLVSVKTVLAELNIIFSKKEVYMYGY